jgi:hypothetical protein
MNSRVIPSKHRKTREQPCNSGALKDFMKVIKCNPDNADAQKALEDLKRKNGERSRQTTVKPNAPSAENAGIFTPKTPSR